jgi:hypothetical protein
VQRLIAGVASSSLTISCTCSVSRATIRQTRSCGPLIASASSTSGIASSAVVASPSRPCDSSTNTNALIG